MSYMVILKNKNGIIICSDSYSTYSNRELKDGNYQKIYRINNSLVVASTGINQIYDDNNQLCDIWDYIKGLFKDVSNIEKLSKIAEKYIEKLQITCDREEKDNTTVFVIQNYVIVVDILHARGHYINFLRPFELDIIFLGEEEHKYHAREYFEYNDMFIGLKEGLKKCKESVKKEIDYENQLYDEGFRVVGGNIQSIVIPNEN